MGVSKAVNGSLTCWVGFYESSKGLIEAGITDLRVFGPTWMTFREALLSLGTAIPSGIGRPLNSVS